MAAHDLIIGGLHAVRSAFEHAANDCIELWLKTDELGDQHNAIAERAAIHGVSLQRVDDATLSKLYQGSHHQGVVLRRRAPTLVRLKDLLAEQIASDQPPLFLLLDTVQDPRNFGACLRVADGAGVSAVLFPRDKSAPVSNVMAKAASGALDTVKLVAVANLAAAMRELKNAGIWLAGAAHDAEQSIYDIDFTQGSAFVLGNEGSGMRRLTREHCDYLAQIPMAGEQASLNVATAAAVCLFEARRQRLAVRR